MIFITCPSTRYQIMTIDEADGTSSIVGVMFDGRFEFERTNVEYATMIDLYAKDTRESFERAPYPENGTLQNKKWEMQEWKSLVIVGPGIVNRQIGDVDVLCRNKPKRGVVTTAHYDVGKLVLIPVSMNI